MYDAEGTLTLVRRASICVASSVAAAVTFAACSEDEIVPRGRSDAGADATVDTGADATVDAGTDATLDVRDDGPGDADGGADVAVDTGPPVAPVDFHVPGTQMGDVSAASYYRSEICSGCHGWDSELPAGPYATWNTSLMAWGGRDPLFFAQMATANQDVPGVGYYCLRCHVPMSVATGHAADWKGTSLDDQDRDGVTCNFCHSMVDPVYVEGKSPAIDAPILAKLAQVPKHYGNAQFVLDPEGTRRGPYDISTSYHVTVKSPFFRSSDLCGTCHDVGNVAVSRLEDGTYGYNAAGAPAPDHDPHAQFPLERTYTEWKLSSFASGGVDMKGRFGGEGASVVSTCQDCHMPRTASRGCILAFERDDLARHDFAGASAWVLRAIATENPSAARFLERGALAAEAMVGRAATLELAQSAGTLTVKLVNETGHKLPTGHIEGRRVWLHVRALDAAGATLAEYGRYDWTTGALDAATTTVFEMQVGLSAKAAALTGLPAGITTHMALADTIVKDNRIPPRGFANAAFAAAGAPVVAATYADGQHWATVDYALPTATRRVRVTAYYQTAPKEYVEHLRDHDTIDDWGKRLHAAWLKTDKGPPIPIAIAEREIAPW